MLVARGSPLERQQEMLLLKSSLLKRRLPLLGSLLGKPGSQDCQGECPLIAPENLIQPNLHDAKMPLAEQARPLLKSA